MGKPTMKNVTFRVNNCDYNENKKRNLALSNELNKFIKVSK